MMHVTLRLVDFMEVTPVANADVSVTVKVVPRWRRQIRSDSDYLRLDPLSWSEFISDFQGAVLDVLALSKWQKVL
jgi:hypothetical protein